MTDDTLTVPGWDYAPAPESPATARLAPSYGLFLGGKWTAASDGRTFTTFDPAHDEPLAEVAAAGPAGRRARRSARP